VACPFIGIDSDDFSCDSLRVMEKRLGGGLATGAWLVQNAAANETAIAAANPDTEDEEEEAEASDEGDEGDGAISEDGDEEEKKPEVSHRETHRHTHPTNYVEHTYSHSQ
jgi:hypothetical protein